MRKKTKKTGSRPAYKKKVYTSPPQKRYARKTKSNYYYSIRTGKRISKTSYKRLKTLEKKSSPDFDTQVQYYKQHFKPIKSNYEVSTLGDIKQRTKALAKMDIVKLGGVGRAFSAGEIEKLLKNVKMKKGKKGIIIEGQARNSKGKLIKDKKIKLSIYLTKGQKRSTLIKEIQKQLRLQSRAYGWVVSAKARKNKNVRGERVKSLNVTLTYSELS